MKDQDQSLVCTVILPDGSVCGDSSSKSPAGLGRHKRFKHNIRGRAHMTAAEKRALEAGSDPEKCFYCPMTFATPRGRTRHITEMHPGKSKHAPHAPELPVLTLTDVKPKKERKPYGSSRRNQDQTITHTQQEFDTLQNLAYWAGYIHAEAHGLADREGLVRTDFTSQLVKIIQRQTVR